MGPFILVDKSFIRSLNPDEARALHRHYSVILQPIVLKELLTDLVKLENSEDEAVKRVVGLALKSSGLGAFTLHDAREMCEADLHGVHFPLGPQIPRFGGRDVISPDGSRGVVI